MASFRHITANRTMMTAAIAILASTQFALPYAIAGGLLAGWLCAWRVGLRSRGRGDHVS
jgi:predicted branched-subunit amino acid permease